MRRILAFLIISILLLSSVPAFAASTENTVEIVDIAYYDIWRHSDGATWVGGVAPGANVSATFNLPFTPKSEIKSIDIKYLDVIQNQFTKSIKKQAVTSATATATYANKAISYTVNCTLNAMVNPQDIKQEWQATAVTGLRYYIPVLITVTYGREVQNTEQSGYFSLSCDTVGGYSKWFFDDYADCKTYYPLSVKSGEQFVEDRIAHHCREYNDGTVIDFIVDGEKVANYDELHRKYILQ